MSSVSERSLQELIEELAQAVVIADPSSPEGLPPVLACAQQLEEGLARQGQRPLVELLAKGMRPLAEAIARGTNLPGALAAASATVSLVQNGLRRGPLPPAPPAAPPAAAAPLAAPIVVPAAPAADSAVADGAPAGSRAAGRDRETVELIADFLQESEDGLAKADEILVSVERGDGEAEAINALFRVFHTIKGVAGFLEFEDVGQLAHHTETLLNLARDGRLALDGERLDAVFDAVERMRALLDGVRSAVEQDVVVEADPDVPALIERLEAVIAEDPAPAPAGRPGTPVVVAAEPAGAAPLPPASAPQDSAEAPFPPLSSAPTNVAENTTETSPARPGSVAANRPASGTPTSAPGQATAPAPRIREVLKVDVERLDLLVEMVGELIITESMVAHDPEVTALQGPRIRKHLSQLTKISRDLQDVAMRMRMVPVRGVFQKMSRLVRELSRRSGKEAVLDIDGENTEMDRSMVERIEDPLVHMIRNSMDHGIEPTQERLAAGKPVPATLRLSAFHEGGSVVIEVSDDGRGLSREKILAKALEKKLVGEGQNLTDAEVYSLIFAPGFSTAAQVTELSGRGVGMDVVKRNIEGMRGRVGIVSTPGAGTTFRMVLPLTLAIIDGMLVGVGAERYIIPSLSIVESLQPREGMLKTLGTAGELLDVRGEILPLYRLSRLFGVAGAKDDPLQSLVVVVESLGRKIGLLVDDVLSQQQVVIKPLGSVGLEEGERFSGAAILSDGRVGLILNVDRLQDIGDGQHRAGSGPAKEETR